MYEEIQIRMDLQDNNMVNVDLEGVGDINTPLYR